MDRTLRWHERLLVRLLLRSPRVDRILIVQVAGESAAERQQNAQQMMRELHRQQLEELYHSS